MTVTIRVRCSALVLTLFAVLAFSAIAHGQETTRLDADGLEQPVEILVDRWGISHIYAETEHDLFLWAGVERRARPTLPARALAPSGDGYGVGDSRSKRTTP